MCAAAGGGSSGGHSKCPLCRANFTSADVVGSAELEIAGGKAKMGEEVDGEKGCRVPDGAMVQVPETMKVPPPKVLALLRR